MSNWLFFGSSSGFAPTDAGMIRGWYDFSDAATVTATGSEVTALADKSGAGLTLTRTSGVGPTLTTSGGRTYGAFISSADVTLSKTGGFADGVGEAIVAFACAFENPVTYSGSGANYAIVSVSGTSQTNYGLMTNNFASGLAGETLGFALGGTFCTDITITAGWHTVFMLRNGAVWDMYVDRLVGNKVTLISGTAGNAASDGFYLGRRANPTVARFFLGNIGGFIGWTSFDTAQLADARTWYADAWNVT